MHLLVIIFHISVITEFFDLGWERWLFYFSFLFLFWINEIARPLVDILQPQKKYFEEDRWFKKVKNK